MIGKDYFPLGTVPSAPKSRSRKFILACNLDKLMWAHNNINLIRKRLRDNYDQNKDIWVGMPHDDTKNRHVVISLYLQNARTVHSIAKTFEVPDYLVLVFKGSVNDLLMYPLHATRDGKFLKRVYPPEKAFSNIDIVARAHKIDEMVAKNSSYASKLMDSFVKQEITYEELLQNLTIDEYLNYRFRIKYAKRDLAKKIHADYKKSMAGRGIKVILLCDLIEWASLHDDALYKKLVKQEGYLKDKYINQRKDLAKRFCASQGRYKEINVNQGFGFGYLGEPTLLFDAGDLEHARSSRRLDNAIDILKTVTAQPQFHDLKMIDDHNIVYLDARTIVICCTGSWSYPYFLKDPIRLPANVEVVGTNSEYERFILNNGL